MIYQAVMSLANNFSNFSLPDSLVAPAMDLATAAPHVTGGILNRLGPFGSIVTGLILLIVGYLVKEEMKDRNIGICTGCNQEKELLKCADKKCKIRICQLCNLKDSDNPILNMCGICGKDVCKEHYGVTHLHKKLGLLFHGAQNMVMSQEIKIEPKKELLEIEYHGNNKELAYILEPEEIKGQIFGDSKEERNILADTILELRKEGYNYKGYIYNFYILEKQGNILPPLPKLETYDFEESEEPVEKYVELEKYN